MTQLADGRALVFSGDNIVTGRAGQPHPFMDAAVNSLPEIYNPKTNSWTDLTSATLTSPLYPFMFLLSNGKVFDAGPDTVTRTLDTTTGTWTTVGTSPFDGMSAVMYRPDKIMKAGTWADPDFSGANLYTADGRTAVIDMGAPSPAWRSTTPMAFGRAYENLTMLADGTVLASGGMSTSDGTDLSKGVLPAEIWNPDTETWTTVASLTNAARVPLDCDAPPRRPRPDGRRRRLRRCSRPEERRDLLAALPLQGRTADDQLDARRRELRLVLRHLHAERRVDHESLAHPLAVGYTRVRPEPALPVPELHARVGEDHGSGACDREPGTAWRLPALHRQRERRSVPRKVHQDLVDW